MKINDLLTPDELKEFRDLLMIARELSQKSYAVDEFGRIAIHTLGDQGFITDRLSELQQLAFDRFSKPWAANK